MAISGLNNYSNGYVNKYLNNEKKSNGKEIVGKQSIDKTEGVSSSTIRKTATDELSYLSKKFDGYSFVAANYSQGMRYGSLSTTNVAISPQFLSKMANNPELEKEYVKEISNMKVLDDEFERGQAARGWRVVDQGWAIDKNGDISSWAITRKDPKAKSFLQNMSEKTNEIHHAQKEKLKKNKNEINKATKKEKLSIDLKL